MNKTPHEVAQALLDEIHERNLKKIIEDRAKADELKRKPLSEEERRALIALMTGSGGPMKHSKYQPQLTDEELEKLSRMTPEEKIRWFNTNRAK